MIPDRVVPRFCAYVQQDHSPDACWLWTASIGSHGYGQIGWQVGEGRNTMVLAHRVAWWLAHGPIPDGLTVDHRCRVRRCCNPAHLRLLTNVENARDNGMARRTHCPHGHEYTPENTRRDRHGHRFCRACQRASNAQRVVRSVS